MKSLFSFIFLTFLLTNFVYSGDNVKECYYPDNNVIPISPNGNSYLYFDGVNDFIRTKHIRELELLSKQNEVELNFKLKVIPGGVQYILSQFSQNKGWFICYKTSDQSMYFGVSNPLYVSWFKLYDSVDTLWNNYRIVFDLPSSSIQSYKNGTLVTFLSDVHWDYTPSLLSAFGAGTNIIGASYGTQNITGTNFLHGYFDDLIVKVNGINKLNVNFNWGAGQYALDSAGFFLWDRAYSDDPPSVCPDVLHFSFGAGSGPDENDPAWVKEIPLRPTHYFGLGNGFAKWREEPIYEPLESWQANSVEYNGVLYLTGYHNRINATPATQGDTSYGISKWNPSLGKWERAGCGLDGYGLYTCVWNDKLVVTGYFKNLHDADRTEAGSIAIWDGSNWSVLSDAGGTGAGDFYGNENASVFCAKPFGNDLVVCGFFTKVGGVYSNKVGKWTGSKWKAMGKGIDGGPVFTLEVFNNKLYAGGAFNFVDPNGGKAAGIAVWDEQSKDWYSVENYPILDESKDVQSLRVHDNKLWMGGDFKSVNGIECNGIAYFDSEGLWHNIAGTEPEIGLGGSVYKTDITDMLSVGQYLYVCGSFNKINGKICNKVAVYDGTSWCSLGSGVDMRPEGLGLYEGKIIISGDLYSADGRNFNNVVMYDPDNLNIAPDGTSNNNTYPVKFNLYQNYPNPFNPSTAVKFDLPKDNITSLVIFDILGRQVDVVAEGLMKAGSHTIVWNAQNRASGVYFYRIISGDNVQTRKMVLIK